MLGVRVVQQLPHPLQPHSFHKNLRPMVAYADLPNPGPLTPEQRKLVASSAPLLQEHGVEIITLMYQKMFAADKSLLELFNHSRQEARSP